jgi:hypothetical protein
VPDGQREDAALCKKTVNGLKEIGSGLGPSFFPRLLEIFWQAIQLINAGSSARIDQTFRPLHNFAGNRVMALFSVSVSQSAGTSDSPATIID